MPPLDTRIPLMAAQPRNNLTDSYVQAMQLKGMQQQMQAQEAAQQRESQRANLLRQYVGADGRFDTEGAAGALMGMGDIEQGIALGNAGVNRQLLEQKGIEAKRKSALAEIDTRARIIGSSVDEPTFRANLAKLESMGVDVSELQGVPYSPDIIKSIQAQALDAKSQIEIGMKRGEMDEKRADRDRRFSLDERRTAAYERGASQTTINMPGQLAARPLTPEEIQQFNIPPEVAPYMHVDAKGNIARRPLGPGEEGRGKAEQDAQAQAATNSKAYQVWTTAAQGLTQGLKGTPTGPISGRIPALTAEAQIGDAAIAAVAPALKQLFRTAGEGTFTDRDQQMLLDMVPTRQTHPEARKAILANIDAIIKAKLGIDEPGRQTGPKVGDVIDGYEYVGGPPASPNSWKAP